MSKKYVAEFVGTFALSFIVLSAVAAGTSLPLVVPVIAALTLGLFVYTIGALSGCHINPAVTAGLWSIKKIADKDAVGYILAQLAGALVAVAAARAFGVISPAAVPMMFDMGLFMAEMMGMFFFAFGIAAVVYGRVSEQMSGLVVGGSLLLGILMAVVAGSAGILNPAVAFALNSISVVYMLAPIAGSVLGFNAYRLLVGQK
jgi:glycerol uptake facilitator-like aquaporin